MGLDAAAEEAALAALDRTGFAGDAEFVDTFLKVRKTANLVVGVTASGCEAILDMTDALGGSIEHLQAFADLGTEVLTTIQEFLVVTADRGPDSEAEDISEAWASLRARCLSLVLLCSGRMRDSVEDLGGLASEQTTACLEELL